MAKSYRTVDRDQEFLLPPDMREWLPEDHLVWFLIAAVERMDTSAFHTRAQLGGVGRRGYDPEMLLTLFVYAMAQGESSSRRIERLCHTDVAFRVICAQDVPDHTVLARFRQRHENGLVELLTESLVLAAELGMLRLGVVALDGTRIAANASGRANRGERHLRRLASEYVEEIAATDASEDALFGTGQRGDELPEAVRDRTHRGERISRALEQVQARKADDEARRREADQRARAYEQSVVDGTKVNGGGQPAGVDPVVIAHAQWQRAWRAAARKHEAYQQARQNGERPKGRSVLPPEKNAAVQAAQQRYLKVKAKAEAQAKAKAAKEAKAKARAKGKGADYDYDLSPARANLTDPDSRSMPTANGWIQGMNCQTSTSEDVFLLTARATQATHDRQQFLPALDAITETLNRVAERTGRNDLTHIGLLLADAGYDSKQNMTAPGPDRLIPDSRRRRTEARATQNPASGAPPPDASPREQMNHRLRTPEGVEHYRRRSHLVETPNAWIKDGRGLRRFRRRGLPAVQSELSLAAAVTNLLRIAAHGITTHQLQAA